MSLLKEKMQADFLVSLHLEGLIQSSVLDSVDVLMICAPDSLFHPEEIQAIEVFVRQGGGLLWIGDAGLPDFVNDLLFQFGLGFDPVVLCDLGGFNPAFLDISHFSTHPVWPSPCAFSMGWGGTFSTIRSDAAIAWSHSTSWKDLNWNLQYDSGEPQGPFAVILAFPYGEGRVVALSDNSLNDGVLTWEGSTNDDLVLSLLRWLTERVNQTSVVSLPGSDAPNTWALDPAYPNPFNTGVFLRIRMPVSARIVVRVYDVRGRLVRHLLDESRQEGTHLIHWDGKDDAGRAVASGMYLFTLVAQGNQWVRKATLLK